MNIDEAQKASFTLHTQIEKANQIIWNPFITVVDILEEAGEVTQVVKNLEGYSPNQEPKTKDMLASELSDMLWSIFVLAGMYKLDLEKSFKRMLSSYETRFLKRDTRIIS